MHKIRPEAQASIEQTHQRYRDDHQVRNISDEAMSAAGHPQSPDYRLLRRFFESLRYACNSAARRYSYQDEQERSEYWAPSLDMSWNPSGPELSRFGHIYPAHERWGEYIEATAKEGWPASSEPVLYGGCWTIRTKDEALRKALMNLRTELSEGDSWRSMTLSFEDETFYEIQLVLRRELSAAFNSEIAAIVAKHHEGYVLPKKSIDYIAVDEDWLDMADKRLIFSNIPTVVVMAQTVMVPFTTIEGHGQVETITGDLVCLMSEGLPFAQAAIWLKKFLPPSAFKELEAKYGSCTAA